MRLSIVVLIILNASCINYDKRDLNLSFENVDRRTHKPLNWRFYNLPAVSYIVDSEIAYDDAKSLRIETKKNKKNRLPGSIYHFIDGVKSGQNIKFSGYIKTKCTTSDSLGLFISYANTKAEEFKLLKSPSLKGTSDRKKYKLELDKKTDTDNLQVRITLHGSGTIWVDGLDLQIDGKGDPKALYKGLYFWTWNTQEV